MLLLCWMGPLIGEQETLDLSSAKKALAHAQRAVLLISLESRYGDESPGLTTYEEASKALRWVKEEITIVIKKKGAPEKRLTLLRDVVERMSKLVGRMKKRLIPTKEMKIRDEEIIKEIEEAKKELSKINHLSAIAQLKQEVDALCDALLMSTHKIEFSYRKLPTTERVTTICQMLEAKISAKEAKGLREAVVLVEDLELDMRSREKQADASLYQRLQLLLGGLKKMLTYLFLATALGPDKNALVANDSLVEALTIIPYAKLTFVDLSDASNSTFFQLLKERVPALCKATWKEIAQAEGFDASNMVGVQKQIKG